MSVIRVKNETGQWVALPAIKGEKGDHGDDGSKQNLLDNGWFQINQRQVQTVTPSASPVYYCDRWLFSACSGTVAANNGYGGITVKYPGITPYYGPYAEVKQKLEDTTLFGKTVTMSALITVTSADGVVVSDRIFSFTTLMNQEGDGSTQDFYIGAATAECSFWLGNSGGYPCAAVRTASQDELTIKAVKLEIGEDSTLEMDWYPNPALELLRCRRFYYRYPSGTILNGFVTDTRMRFSFSANELNSLRAPPSFTGEGKISFRGSGVTSAASASTGIAILNDTTIWSRNERGDYSIKFSTSIGSSDKMVFSMIILENSWVAMSADL